MDLVLRERLPLELVEIIMRYVWEMNMKNIHYIFENNLVWIRAKEGYSYIISENINYYAPLLNNPYGSYAPLTRRELREAKKKKNQDLSIA